MGWGKATYGEGLKDIVRKHKMLLESYAVTRTETKADKFRKIVNDMAELYEKKNHDYGDSFGKVWEEEGLRSGIIMLKHKMARIDMLSNKENMVKGETIEDSLIDLAAYAIMTLIELE